MIQPHLIFETIDEACDLDDLRERLRKKGIEAKFVQAQGAAEPTGWLMRQSGPAGTWLKGSDVDRGLSIKKVRERMEERRMERQRRLVRELLGDLLDEVEQPEREQNKVDDKQEPPQQQLARGQRSLIGAIIQIPLGLLRRLIAALMNRIAAFLERLFGLRDGALGRIEVDHGGQPHAVAPAEPTPDSTERQLAQLAQGQKLMAAALAKTVEAIKQGDPRLLPGATVKDVQVQAARQAVIDKVEKIEADQNDDDEQQHERERPQ